MRVGMEVLMAVLVLLGLISVAFILGSFLAFPVLVGISLICLIVCVAWLMRAEELESFLALMIALYALIGNFAMWVTYYVSTGQTWLGEMLHGHILR